MRYIRRKDNPAKVVAFGFVAPGGLGSFDPDVFEEVEGELPGNFEQEAPPSLTSSLNKAFMALPVEVRAQFYMVKAAVKAALESDDTEAAKQIITELNVDPSLQSVKTTMLGLFK